MLLLMKAFGVFVVSLGLAGLALAGCGSKTERPPAARAPAAPKLAETPPSATNADHDPKWIQRPLIKDRLERLFAGLSPDYFSLQSQRGLLFLLKTAPLAQHPILISLQSVTNLDSERIILDPNLLPNNPAIDSFVPSLDGKWIAVSLLETNSQEGTLQVYSAATGERRPDVIPHVSSTSSAAAWNADGTGLFYTRSPGRGARPDSDRALPAQVYFHRLGTPLEDDVYELGKGFLSSAQIELKSSPDGTRLLASVADNQAGASAHFLRERSGEWRQVTRFEDKVDQVEFGRDPLYIEWGNDPALYLLSRQDAPKGKVLRLSFGAASLTAASTIVEEGKDVIANIKPAASGLALVFSQAGPSQFGFLDYFDKKIRRVDGQRFSTVPELLVLQGDDVLFRVESYTEPYEWLHYNSSRSKERLNSTSLAGEASVSFGDVEVVREQVKSEDGTLVYLDLMRKRGTGLTQSTPTILSRVPGLHQTPQFEVWRRLWLDQGGVFAMANLRARSAQNAPSPGALADAQPGADSFAACAAYLIRSNYTSAAKLAVHSAGLDGLFGRARTRTGVGGQIAQLADAYASVCEELGVELSQVDRGPWSGGVTPTSIVVKAKLIRDGLTAKLLVSQSQNLADPIPLPSVVSKTDAANMVEFTVANLEPDRQFYYALEVNGRIERQKTGAFRTLPPPGPASFTFAFAGDARTGSVNEVFDRIREHAPLFFMNLGDFHYLDIQSTNRAHYRDGYDAVLASPQQSDLYRNVPFVYIWDDHDFTGNNSNRKAIGRGAARLTYQEYVPHYPLPLGSIERDGGPICQSFSVGRVKFILTDLRSERDDARKKDDFTKTMMGAAQKAWFKQELLAANGRYPLICWASSVPWIGKAGTNFYHGIKTNQYGLIDRSQLALTANSHTNQNVVPGAEDWWSVYASERREIADFMKENRIHGVCILHADSHMLAADDGTHSDYATGGGAPLPVMCAAPLDKEPSIKGGPYSQGVYRVRPGEGCYALVTVSDRGAQIDVSFSGRNHLDEEKVSLQFSVRAAPVNAAAD